MSGNVEVMERKTEIEFGGKKMDCTKGTGQPAKVIGSISVFRCENIHYRTAELRYYIGESYWGKGITTSAVQQICEYVFSHSNILRIFAEPFSHNIASCRVLERQGSSLRAYFRKMR